MNADELRSLTEAEETKRAKADRIRADQEYEEKQGRWREEGWANARQLVAELDEKLVAAARSGQRKMQLEGAFCNCLLLTKKETWSVWDRLRGRSNPTDWEWVATQTPDYTQFVIEECQKRGLRLLWGHGGGGYGGQGVRSPSRTYLEISW